MGLGVLSFAFVCQHSAFIIAGSMERPTIARWSTVTRGALSFCCVLALLCGISGYLGFLEGTRGNVLKNLDDDSWIANAARAMLGITMLFVYPLESFVARHVCVVLLFSGRRAHEGDDTTILNRRDRRIGLTVLLYIFAVIPAAVFDDLGPVFALTGAVGGSCLSYIGPGLIYLGIHGDRFLELVDESWLGSLTRQNLDGDDKSVKPGGPAGELTPLVNYPVRKAPDEASEVAESTSDYLVVKCIKGFLWCVLGMPLWYFLAHTGKEGLDKHAREMAMKSPHPIRIGSVEYTRPPQLERQDHRATIDANSNILMLSPGHQLVRHDSFQATRSPVGSLLPTSPVPSLHDGRPPRVVGINEILGKELLQRRKLQEKRSVIEKDEQATPATWCDFGIAIFFVMFGMLALFAGVLSLFQGNDVELEDLNR